MVISGSITEVMASVNCLSQSPPSIEKFRITNYVVHTSELLHFENRSWSDVAMR